MKKQRVSKNLHAESAIKQTNFETENQDKHIEIKIVNFITTAASTGGFSDAVPFGIVSSGIISIISWIYACNRESW